MVKLSLMDGLVDSTLQVRLGYKDQCLANTAMVYNAQKGRCMPLGSGYMEHLDPPVVMQGMPALWEGNADFSGANSTSTNNLQRSDTLPASDPPLTLPEFVGANSTANHPLRSDTVLAFDPLPTLPEFTGANFTGGTTNNLRRSDAVLAFDPLPTLPEFTGANFTGEATNNLRRSDTVLAFDPLPTLPEFAGANFTGGSRNNLQRFDTLPPAYDLLLTLSEFAGANSTGGFMNHPQDPDTQPFYARPITLLPGKPNSEFADANSIQESTNHLQCTDTWQPLTLLLHAIDQQSSGTPLPDAPLAPAAEPQGIPIASSWDDFHQSIMNSIVSYAVEARRNAPPFDNVDPSRPNNGLTRAATVLSGLGPSPSPASAGTFSFGAHGVGPPAHMPVTMPRGDPNLVLAEGLPRSDSLQTIVSGGGQKPTDRAGFLHLDLGLTGSFGTFPSEDQSKDFKSLEEHAA